MNEKEHGKEEYYNFKFQLHEDNEKVKIPTQTKEEKNDYLVIYCLILIVPILLSFLYLRTLVGLLVSILSLMCFYIPVFKLKNHKGKIVFPIISLFLITIVIASYHSNSMGEILFANVVNIYKGNDVSITDFSSIHPLYLKSINAKSLDKNVFDVVDNRLVVTGGGVATLSVKDSYGNQSYKTINASNNDFKTFKVYFKESILVGETQPLSVVTVPHSNLIIDYSIQIVSGAESVRVEDNQIIAIKAGKVIAKFDSEKYGSRNIEFEVVNTINPLYIGATNTDLSMQREYSPDTYIMSKPMMVRFQVNGIDVVDPDTLVCVAGDTVIESFENGNEFEVFLSEDTNVLCTDSYRISNLIKVRNSEGLRW